MSCLYCEGPVAGSVTLAELVDRDFNRARLRVMFGRLVARLQGGVVPDRLVCFSEGRSWEISSRRVLGLQAVELVKIVGSVGRCRDFDHAFMPACSCMGERWKRVDKALREGRHLPPVRLYKIGEQYFVEDGNHRVSVSRYRGLPMIEAVVTELFAGESEGRR